MRAHFVAALVAAAVVLAMVSAPLASAQSISCLLGGSGMATAGRMTATSDGRVYYAGVGTQEVQGTISNGGGYTFDPNLEEFVSVTATNELRYELQQANGNRLNTPQGRKVRGAASADGTRLAFVTDIDSTADGYKPLPGATGGLRPYARAASSPTPTPLVPLAVPDQLTCTDAPAVGNNGRVFFSCVYVGAAASCKTALGTSCPAQSNVAVMYMYKGSTLSFADGGTTTATTGVQPIVDSAGRWMVYLRLGTGVVLVDSNAPSSTTITTNGADTAVAAAVSGDGSLVFWVSAVGQVYRASTATPLSGVVALGAGLAPAWLPPDNQGVTYLTASATGASLVVWRNSQLYLVDGLAAAGNATLQHVLQLVTQGTTTSPAAAVLPGFSPDGNTLYYGYDGTNAAQGRLCGATAVNPARSDLLAQCQTLCGGATVAAACAVPSRCVCNAQSNETVLGTCSRKMVCGDGILTPPEQCDDGGVLSQDGCSPTCTAEDGYECRADRTPQCLLRCGNGFQWNGTLCVLQNNGSAVCGDDKCDVSESCLLCPEDCGDCDLLSSDSFVEDTTDRSWPYDFTLQLSTPDGSSSGGRSVRAATPPTAQRRVVLEFATAPLIETNRASPGALSNRHFVLRLSCDKVSLPDVSRGASSLPLEVRRLPININVTNTLLKEDVGRLTWTRLDELWSQADTDAGRWRVQDFALTTVVDPANTSADNPVHPRVNGAGETLVYQLALDITAELLAFIDDAASAQSPFLALAMALDTDNGDMECRTAEFSNAYENASRAISKPFLSVLSTSLTNGARAGGGGGGGGDNTLAVAVGVPVAVVVGLAVCCLIVVLLALLVALLVVAVVVRRRRRNNHHFLRRGSGGGNTGSLRSLKSLRSSAASSLRLSMQSDHRQSREGVELSDEIPIENIKLIEKIGGGAAGDVYRGVWMQGSVRTEVAVKRVNSSAVEDIDEFTKEIEILRNLHHPNILRYFGVSYYEGDMLLITEFMGRGSLEVIVHGNGKRQPEPLAMPRLLKYLLDAARGINYLHHYDPVIVHRDIKTGNLLVDEHDVVKVADFGISTVVTVTETMTSCGTPAYMAPEVLRNERYTEKADVYSFALTMWECVAQRRPHANCSPTQVIYQVLTKNFRPDVPESCPPDLAKLIVAAWDNDPANRPDFNHIVRALQRLLGEDAGDE